MQGHHVALAAEMRGSRPAVELSGPEMCLLTSGTERHTSRVVTSQQESGPYRILREHLGLDLFLAVQP